MRTVARQWQRWWPVAELWPAEEKEERRNRFTEERERVTVAIGWWLTVVELVVEKPMVALFGGWDGGEREEEKKNCRDGGRGWFFGRLWTLFSPPSFQLRLYL